MTASRTNRCPVKWSTKPENTKMLGKLIVVIIYIYIYIYIQQSFFGFFIDAGASKGLISITAVATIIQQEG